MEILKYCPLNWNILNGSSNERVEKLSACRDKNPGKLESNYWNERLLFDTSWTIEFLTNE